MFRSSTLFVSLAVFCSSVYAQALGPDAATPKVLSKIVVVGDSISAGVENFSLLDSQQPHGYASVIAQQAGVSLPLPLVPYPGVPNVLQLKSLNPLTIVNADPGVTPNPPRDSQCTQPTTLSIPGVTLEQAMTVTPTSSYPPLASNPLGPVANWADIVLGYPSPLAAQTCGVSPVSQTEVQQAVALKPSAIIEWLGNNDALVPALIGVLSDLTPIPTFINEYETLLNTLKQTGAPIVTATVPDVTKAPYFTPVSVIARKTNSSPQAVAAKLGIGPNDLLRETAVPIAMSILAGHEAPAGWPTTCPAPNLDLPVPSVPCVLTASDAVYVQGTIDAYNAIIFSESLLHGAAVVDTHALVDSWAQNGYNADGKHLTLGFLGGLISLDGIHPTNTGYAIMANTFINVINAAWGVHIPQADVNAVAAHDPLFKYADQPYTYPPVQ